MNEWMNEWMIPIMMHPGHPQSPCPSDVQVHKHFGESSSVTLSFWMSQSLSLHLLALCRCLSVYLPLTLCPSWSILMSQSVSLYLPLCLCLSASPSANKMQRLIQDDHTILQLTREADLLSNPLNKTRDQDQDFGHQVSRPRPWPPGLEALAFRSRVNSWFADHKSKEKATFLLGKQRRGRADQTCSSRQDEVEELECRDAASETDRRDSLLHEHMPSDDSACDSSPGFASQTAYCQRTNSILST